MTNEVWCLLFNNENSHLENVKDVNLVVWRCKELTLSSTQGDDELQDYLLEIDFHNKKQVIKLASGAEIADLELGQKEVLLVKVLGAISNFICSQLHSLAATNLGSKKQKLEEETPSTNFIKGENRNFFTV